MPELLLELFSEEIPARMQARAAEDLARLVKEALAPLEVRELDGFYGPRRIALVADVAPELPVRKVRERGPRADAPDAAIYGFLRKHRATTVELRQEGGYWLLERSTPAVPAGALIAAALPGVLRRFPWPKAMRWGSSSFTWVRPLRRILCLLGGEIVPFTLAEGEDDGHGLISGHVTEGHRFHAPGAFAVASASDWQDRLRECKVIPDAGERKRRIEDGLAHVAAKNDLPWDSASNESGLLDEVAGLAEWPVVLMGEIDASFMNLPPEVMRVTMRVNQRYFAFSDRTGALSRKFAFVANIEAADGGAAIIAGNGRVLRARLADARHFWDQDRRMRLAARLPKLEHVVFHARLGSQGARVRRIVDLVRMIAPAVGAPSALAERAALLAKADLVSGMVGEFPELQGVMGGYYAENDGEAESVAAAIREHYSPKGPDDAVPTAPVSTAVALADKLDLLSGFFAIGEKPTGSGDPFGLRRAALGIIRILRTNALHLDLLPVIERWREFVLQERGEDRAIRPDAAALAALPEQVLAFIVERLRVALRAEGERHDVLAAVFAAVAEDDLLRLLEHAEMLSVVLKTDAGSDLLTGYRRAANIVRIEEGKDGVRYNLDPDPTLFRSLEEKELGNALVTARNHIKSILARQGHNFVDIGMAAPVLGMLRERIDAFFERVTVNAQESELRVNRLHLLAGIRDTLNLFADLSRIEG